MHIGDRNQLHSSGGHGVETRKLSASRIESQRELLRAVAKKISSRDAVFLAEAVVNLGDKAAQVVK